MKKHFSFYTLTLTALGVVFGDIGTSPLYALNELFYGNHPLVRSPENILGSVSLVFWVLTLAISIKYMIFVLKANNDGEGGVFALYGLLHPFRKNGNIFLLMTILITASGLLFGDGMITPAISVLSAVEGLKLINSSFSTWILPLTFIIIILLFYIQKKGTAKVGSFFGPIILVWFVVIGSIGAFQIFQTPNILISLLPIHAWKFLLILNSKQLMYVLGGVLLAITGGEALYADMGHFGIKPIRLSWFIIVYPALILSYLGQGAFLLSSQTVKYDNLFFSQVPFEFLTPMVVLATMAAIIASQALISGAFSLTSQAVALGLLPRIKVIHTHHEHFGQIYVPFINWFLCFGCLILVYKFQSSTNLATVYGFAASADMLITSVTMIFILNLYSKWSHLKILTIFGIFIIIDLLFLTANSFKILEGGYIPLGIGILIGSIMLTWRWGRKITYMAYSKINSITLKELIKIKNETTHYHDKNVILMVPKPIQNINEKIPALMQLIYNRHKVLARNIIFVEVIHKKVPYIYKDRYDVTIFDKSAEKGMIISVAIKFGFMEEPNVEKVLASMATHHELTLSPDPHHWIVYASHENIIKSSKWDYFMRKRLQLFALLRQVSQPGYYYYGLGDEVQLSVEILPIRITHEL